MDHFCELRRVFSNVVIDLSRALKILMFLQRLPLQLGHDPLRMIESLRSILKRWDGTYDLKMIVT